MVYSATPLSRNHYTAFTLAAGIVALSLIAYLFRRSMSYSSQNSSPSSFVATYLSLEAVKKENLDMTQKGAYSLPDGTMIKLRNGAQLAAATQLVKIESVDPEITNRFQTKFQVVQQDTLAAAQSLVAKGNKVAVLNFASHLEPGGGFQEAKAGSQEEDLAYCAPELGAFFIDQVDKFTSDSTENYFYPLKQENTFSADAHLLHSPDVWICRSKSMAGYPFLRTPFQVGVITAAAIYQPKIQIISSSINGESTIYADDQDALYMVLCIETQLKTALRNGYDTIVLGAFGCGAFKNPPEAVANMYHRDLTKKFKGAFKEVVFAILDDPNKQQHNPQGNFKPFADRFK